MTSDMRKIILVCVVFTLGLGHSFAEKGDSLHCDSYGTFKHMGANLNVGTEGIGIGVGMPISNYFELSLGVNFMLGFKPYDYVNMQSDGVSIPQMVDGNTPLLNASGQQIYRTYSKKQLKLEGNTSRVTFDFKLNAYPFGLRNDLFVAAGISFGGAKICDLEGHSDAFANIYAENPYYAGDVSVEVAKSYLAVDHQGNTSGELRVKSVRPYFGLGYGRQVPRRRIGFRVEAGLQMMGRMNVYQNGQKLTVYDSMKSDDGFTDWVDRWRVYPVFKLALTTRLF